MIYPAMDRGGLKDSENAPNSFFPKINRTVFWRLGTDMYMHFYNTNVWVKGFGKTLPNRPVKADTLTLHFSDFTIIYKKVQIKCQVSYLLLWEKIII